MFYSNDNGNDDDDDRIMWNHIKMMKRKQLATIS